MFLVPFQPPPQPTFTQGTQSQKESNQLFLQMGTELLTSEVTNTLPEPVTRDGWMGSKLQADREYGTTDGGKARGPE